MDTITIRQGETLQIPITVDDTSAISVRFVAADSTGIIIIDETEAFATNDGKATATIFTNDTLIEAGEYEYMLQINYTDNVIDILPDSSDCSGGDCALPKLIICESLLYGVS